ncbi:MAG: hypothetical protein WEG36_16515 [Gemmatimonadota bacterium]
MKARSILLLTTSLLLLAEGGIAQSRPSFDFGQGVSPAFEGWEENEDGSFNIVFGYMNRNWEEKVQVPVGPSNYFALVDHGALNDSEVSGYDANRADQGQPTVFLPRRNRFIFKVRVPASFAEGSQELVWTLESGGSLERAYGSLARDYRIDNMIIMSETGALGAGSSNEQVRANTPPVIELETGIDQVLTVRTGESVTLAARVTDDGVPRRGGSAPSPTATPEQLLNRALNPPRRITVGKVNGLYFSWYVYRGQAGPVSFDPPQVKTWEDTRAFANSPWAPFWVPPAAPEGDRWVTIATFNEPGTYILRGRADDGGLFSDVEVTVQVTGPVL